MKALRSRKVRQRPDDASSCSAARYSRLLHFVAERVLGNPNKAAIAVDNCLYGAAQHVTASD